MPTPYEKLSSLLKELFQLDQADLDFGIYRIMNQKRDEITRFLDKDLLPQVKTAFDLYRPADKKVLEEKIEQARQAAIAAGFDPELSPKVKELRDEQAAYSVDTGALENEVYSHLYSFFRRYYDNGDFISMRRYKEGVYAIPYEGEEVKLHWANADQYYIKTTENFRDYTFHLPSGRLAHFKIVEADTEKDNIKAADEKDRRFILATEGAVSGEEGALVMRFEYRSDPEKRDQKTLNNLAIESILANAPADWLTELRILKPTDTNPNRTLLEKHLTDYSARNSFDYFIHKDLRGFLNRELDFYIKNEVMHLDDIEEEGAPRVEQYLSKIKALRSIAHKIINFLAQIEDFQKKLWLKKKFVVETNYCISLDRVPEELYDDIISNNRQIEEWIDMSSIDEIKHTSGDLISKGKVGFSRPLTKEFLEQNPGLVIDTHYFPEDDYRLFRNTLVSNFDSLDNSFSDLLIYGENYQGLNLLFQKYKGKVKCIYIDPPFNLGENGDFLYKTNYLDSSWLSMLHDRLLQAKELLSSDGVILVRCDYHGNYILRSLLNVVFGIENFKNEIIINRFQKASEGLTATTESLFFYSKSSEFNINQVLKPRECIFCNSKIEPKWQWSHSAGESKLPRYFVVNGERVLLYPPKGRHWTNKQEKIDQMQNDGRIRIDFSTKYTDSNGDKVPYIPEKLQASSVDIDNNWTDISGYEFGVFTKEKFSTQNAEVLLERVIQMASSPNDIVMDFFMGSGTTQAVAQKLGRRWIGIEIGNYFFDKPLKRLKRLVNQRDYAKSFKYLITESYEDTLNNLTLNRTDEQQLTLEAAKEFNENYMLSYMLDVESKGSLLNIQSFVRPFDYQLNIASGTVGESQPTKVDLVETFNYLIGLQVETLQSIRGFHVVTGKNPAGERTLIIWRDLKEKSNQELETFFRKQDYNPRDMEYDLIYVNGDNNLENLRRPDETWKVRLIEEEFLRLMFDTENN